MRDGIAGMRLHFLNIAEGSLAELGYCLHVAHRLGYITDATFAELERDLNGVGAPLAGLVRSTRRTVIAFPVVTIAGIVMALWLG